MTETIPTNLRKLIGRTVRYKFDGSEYTHEVIDAASRQFTVRLDDGLRRVLHQTSIVAILPVAP